MSETREMKGARTAALRALLPDDATLLGGLTAVFGEDGAARGPVTLLERQPNRFASTFPSEIVTCRLSDGRELRALCKYGRGRSHTSYGHRGDVAYEADVYRHVIQPLRSSAPQLYGSHTRTTNETWLVIEYVDEAVRLPHATPMPHPPRRAARWIAQFHADNAARLARAPMPFLNAYDGDYYRQWVHRTLALSSRLPDRLVWLTPVCERFASRVDVLLERPTVIHGEYTPKNTLVQGDRVCPVDWESAAIAAGEIDLASLTDGKWSTEIAETCVREYERVRWPEGAPSDFAVRLGLARLYWNLRWLGERLDWTTSEKGVKRLDYLRAAAEQMELL
jgi:aminoglycoside phosphotransferase (APT) family kinase protein